MIGSSLYELLDDKLKTEDHIFACFENGLNEFKLNDIKRIKETFLSDLSVKTQDFCVSTFDAKTDNVEWFSKCMDY